MVKKLGIKKVQGSGYKAQGSGYKVQGSRFRVQGAGGVNRHSDTSEAREYRTPNVECRMSNVELSTFYL